MPDIWVKYDRQGDKKMLEFDEFYDLLRKGIKTEKADDWRYFYILFNTDFYSNGLPARHTCKICGYSTDLLYGEITPEDVNRIDSEIIGHAWTKHRYVATRMLEEIRSYEVFRSNGQHTLLEYRD